ncbi:hypothetical protein FNV43_RR00256 [Rhamnella rubrinervis]|uniref:Protein kinase domain-containing protein n=1 Tax=Rhamnella rubrinervis TaxID=2594499 RepID=A0A8K0HNC2_9ROSA|nr:hypothetical protein FNV43_RR00256 [Rhamnella rubrinervis]
MGKGPIHSKSMGEGSPLWPSNAGLVRFYKGCLTFNVLYTALVEFDPFDSDDNINYLQFFVKAKDIPGTDVNLHEDWNANHVLSCYNHHHFANTFFLYHYKFAQYSYRNCFPRSSNTSGNLHGHCNWVGITCDELGSVIHINLNGCSLRGENNITGSIPHEIGQLKTIKELDLYDNYLSGSIPSSIGNLRSLTALSLFYNNLIGSIPLEMNNLTDLETLQFSANFLSGRLPPELGKAAQLHKLDLSSNLLVGNISNELGRLKHLYFLKLNRNALSGKFPGQIGMLFDLEQLDVIGNLQTLRGLDLSHNFLTGELPMELGYLRMLEMLNLSHNNFTGSVPSTFKDMLSLTSVDMSNNQLRGPLPSDKAFTMARMGNNKGFCGNNTGLKPCPTPKNGKSHGLVILVTVSVFGTLGLLFMIIVGIVFCCKHIERNVEEPTETQNETFFSICNHDGKKNGGEASKKAFTSEISVLTIARHRNIIKLYGYCSHARHSFLVYEFIEKGSLANMLCDKVRAIGLEWSKRVNIVKAHLADFGTGRPLVHEPSSSDWGSFAGTFGLKQVVDIVSEIKYALPVTSSPLLYLVSASGDLISSMLTSSLPENFHQILLKDVLDQRLLPPKNQIAQEVVSIAMLAFACPLRIPESRPYMKQVSQKLSTSIPSSSIPLFTMSLAQILHAQHV